MGRKQPIERLKRRCHLSAWLTGWWVRGLKDLDFVTLRSVAMQWEGRLVTDSYQAAKVLAVKRELAKR
jgi:hypothetical protein